MTGLNAADLLISFFRAKSKEPFNSRAIVLALVEIESHVELWESSGSDVQSFKEAMPVWRGEAFHFIEPTTGNFRTYNETGNLGVGELGLLGWVSERIATSTPKTDGAGRESIRDMVQKARKLLIADNSLPDRLRLHVSRLLRHVEEALDNYDITGEFLLEDAVERLIGALHIVESRSSEPTKWQKFRDEFVPAVAAQLAATGALEGMAAITVAVTSGQLALGQS